MALGLCKYNPAVDIDGLIKPEPKSTPYRHITEPDEIGLLLVALDEFQGSPQSRTLAILHPLIFTRPTELRMMRWDEIDRRSRIKYGSVANIRMGSVVKTCQRYRLAVKHGI